MGIKLVVRAGGCKDGFGANTVAEVRDFHSANFALRAIEAWIPGTAARLEDDEVFGDGLRCILGVEI
jgi:hypothetical protein